MDVVYARCAFPSIAKKVLFLAGPTPRDSQTVSWRWEALKVLKELGFDGTVYVPEDEGGGMSGSYSDQIVWEGKALDRSDVVVFWVPRKMGTMPGLTTNDEFGAYKGRTRIVFGAPEEAEKVRYQRFYCEKLGIRCFATLEETLAAAVKLVGKGALREGSDTLVPAHVFETEVFQHWKTRVLTQQGNVLLDARVRDLVLVGERVFLFVLWAKVFISSENRVKDNELLVGRAPVSCIAVYCPGETVLDTRVVLIREFRTG